MKRPQDIDLLRPLIMSAALTLPQREALADLVTEHDERAELDRQKRAEDDTARMVRPMGTTRGDR